MISIRTLEGDAKTIIDAFYQSEGRSTRVSLDERFVVAEQCEHIVGVVRLCVEEGHTVLRTMRLTENARRRGIGTKMLHVFAKLAADRECFCLPLIDLQGFYSQIGFERISDDAAPLHLQDRLEKGRSSGVDMCAMRRPPSKCATDKSVDSLLCV